MSTTTHGTFQEGKSLLCMHFVRTVVLRFNLHVEHFNKLMHLSTSPWSCASLTDVGALLTLLCRSSSNFFLASAASSLDNSDLYLSVSLTCSVHFEPILEKKKRRQKYRRHCGGVTSRLQPSVGLPWHGSRRPVSQ